MWPLSQPCTAWPIIASNVLESYTSQTRNIIKGSGVGGFWTNSTITQLWWEIFAGQVQKHNTLFTRSSLWSLEHGQDRQQHEPPCCCTIVPSVTLAKLNFWTKDDFGFLINECVIDWLLALYSELTTGGKLWPNNLWRWENRSWEKKPGQIWAEFSVQKLKIY